MKQALPIIIFGLVLVFPGWVWANHQCGEGCDQWTAEGACTHGCWAGGASNPDYRNPDEGYKYNAPPQHEVERARREAGEQRDRAARAADEAERQEAEKLVEEAQAREESFKRQTEAANQARLDLANQVAQVQDQVAAAVGTEAAASLTPAVTISATAQAAREAQTARCSQELGLCPMIDPDSLQVVGWVPADTAVFGTYDEAKLARMNVIVGTGYKTVTLDGKDYQAYDFSGETQETSLTDLSAAEVARIKASAEANKVQVDAQGAMIVNQVYDLEEFKQRVDAFHDEQVKIQEKIANSVAKPEVLQGHARGCAEQNNGVVCGPDQLWGYIQEKTEVELVDVTNQNNWEEAVRDHAGFAERIDTVLRLVQQNLTATGGPPIDNVGGYLRSHPEWFADFSEEEKQGAIETVGQAVLESVNRQRQVQDLALTFSRLLEVERNYSRLLELSGPLDLSAQEQQSLEGQVSNLLVRQQQRAIEAALGGLNQLDPTAPDYQTQVENLVAGLPQLTGENRNFVRQEADHVQDIVAVAEEIIQFKLANPDNTFAIAKVEADLLARFSSTEDQQKIKDLVARQEAAVAAEAERATIVFKQWPEEELQPLVEVIKNKDLSLSDKQVLEEANRQYSGWAYLSLTGETDRYFSMDDVQRQAVLTIAEQAVFQDTGHYINPFVSESEFRLQLAEKGLSADQVELTVDKQKQFQSQGIVNWQTAVDKDYRLGLNYVPPDFVEVFNARSTPTVSWGGISALYPETELLSLPVRESSLTRFLEFGNSLFFGLDPGSPEAREAALIDSYKLCNGVGGTGAEVTRCMGLAGTGYQLEKENFASYKTAQTAYLSTAIVAGGLTGGMSVVPTLIATVPVDAIGSVISTAIKSNRVEFLRDEYEGLAAAEPGNLYAAAVSEAAGVQAGQATALEVGGNILGGILGEAGGRVIVEGVGAGLGKLTSVFGPRQVAEEAVEVATTDALRAQLELIEGTNRRVIAGVAKSGDPRVALRQLIDEAGGEIRLVSSQLDNGVPRVARLTADNVGNAIVDVVDSRPVVRLGTDTFDVVADAGVMREVDQVISGRSGLGGLWDGLKGRGSVAARAESLIGRPMSQLDQAVQEVRVPVPKPVAEPVPVVPRAPPPSQVVVMEGQVYNLASLPEGIDKRLVDLSQDLGIRPSLFQRVRQLFQAKPTEAELAQLFSQNLRQGRYTVEAVEGRQVLAMVVAPETTPQDVLAAEWANRRLVNALAEVSDFEEGLKEAQIRTVMEATTKGKAIVTLETGAGKTTVINPLITQQAVLSGRPVLQVYPANLLEPGIEAARSLQQKGFYQVPVWVFDGQFKDLSGVVVQPRQVLSLIEKGQGFVVIGDVNQVQWGRLLSQISGVDNEHAAALARIFGGRNTVIVDEIKPGAWSIAIDPPQQIGQLTDRAVTYGLSPEEAVEIFRKTGDSPLIGEVRVNPRAVLARSASGNLEALDDRVNARVVREVLETVRQEVPDGSVTRARIDELLQLADERQLVSEFDALRGATELQARLDLGVPEEVTAWLNFRASANAYTDALYSRLYVLSLTADNDLRLAGQEVGIAAVGRLTGEQHNNVMMRMALQDEGGRLLGIDASQLVSVDQLEVSTRSLVTDTNDLVAAAGELAGLRATPQQIAAYTGLPQTGGASSLHVPTRLVVGADSETLVTSVRPVVADNFSQNKIVMVIEADAGESYEQVSQLWVDTAKDISGQQGRKLYLALLNTDGSYKLVNSAEAQNFRVLTTAEALYEESSRLAAREDTNVLAVFKGRVEGENFKSAAAYPRDVIGIVTANDQSIAEVVRQAAGRVRVPEGELPPYILAMRTGRLAMTTAEAVAVLTENQQQAVRLLEFERALRELGGVRQDLVEGLGEVAGGNQQLVAVVKKLAAQIQEPVAAFPTIPRRQDPFEVFYDEYVRVRRELASLLEGAEQEGFDSGEVQRLARDFQVEGQPVAKASLNQVFDQPTEGLISKPVGVDERAWAWARVNSAQTVPEFYGQGSRAQAVLLSPQTARVVAERQVTNQILVTLGQALTEKPGDLVNAVRVAVTGVGQLPVAAVNTLAAVVKSAVPDVVRDLTPGQIAVVVEEGRVDDLRGLQPDGTRSVVGWVRSIVDSGSNEAGLIRILTDDVGLAKSGQLSVAALERSLDRVGVTASPLRAAIVGTLTEMNREAQLAAVAPAPPAEAIQEPAGIEQAPHLPAVAEPLATTPTFVAYMVGVEADDPALPQRLLDDHLAIKQKYGLPDRGMRFDSPGEYIARLEGIAVNNGVPIRDKSEFKRFFDENPIAGAAYDDKGRQIFVDRGKEAVKLAGDLEHELIYALQHQRYPDMPVEAQEYEAYVGANMRIGGDFLADPDNIEIVFAQIAASSRNWYNREGLAIPWEAPKQLVAVSGVVVPDASLVVPIDMVSRPVFSNVIPTSVARTWLEAYPEGIEREAAQFLLDNVTHVDQATFEQALMRAVEEFNKEIPDRYVVVTTGSDKSSQWVYELASSHLARPPVAVVDFENVQQWLADRPEVADGVVIDDASYSGAQLKVLINSVRTTDPNRPELIHVLVPYLSTNAKAFLESLGQVVSADKVGFRLYPAETIPSLAEILAGVEDEDIRGRLESVIKGRYGFTTSLELRQTWLTYFDHKVPDGRSFFGVIRDAAIIPETREPYKAGYEEWIRGQLAQGRKPMGMESAPAVAGQVPFANVVVNTVYALRNLARIVLITSQDVVAEADLLPDAVQFRAAVGLANERIGQIVPGWVPAQSLGELWQNILGIADLDLQEQALVILGGIGGEDIRQAVARLVEERLMGSTLTEWGLPDVGELGISQELDDRIRNDFIGADQRDLVGKTFDLGQGWQISMLKFEGNTRTFLLTNASRGVATVVKPYKGVGFVTDVARLEPWNWVRLSEAAKASGLITPITHISWRNGYFLAPYIVGYEGFKFLLQTDPVETAKKAADLLIGASRLGVDFSPETVMNNGHNVFYVTEGERAGSIVLFDHESYRQTDGIAVVELVRRQLEIELKDVYGSLILLEQAEKDLDWHLRRVVFVYELLKQVRERMGLVSLNFPVVAEDELDLVVAERLIPASVNEFIDDLVAQVRAGEQLVVEGKAFRPKLVSDEALTTEELIKGLLRMKGVSLVVPVRGVEERPTVGGAVGRVIIGLRDQARQAWLGFEAAMANLDVLPDEIQFKAAVGLANARIGQIVPGFVPARTLGELWQNILGIADLDLQEQALVILGGIEARDIQRQVYGLAIDEAMKLAGEMRGIDPEFRELRHGYIAKISMLQSAALVAIDSLGGEADNLHPVLSNLDQILAQIAEEHPEIKSDEELGQVITKIVERTSQVRLGPEPVPQFDKRAGEYVEKEILGILVSLPNKDLLIDQFIHNGQRDQFIARVRAFFAKRYGEEMAGKLWNYLAYSRLAKNTIAKPKFAVGLMDQGVLPQEFVDNLDRWYDENLFGPDPTNNPYGSYGAKTLAEKVQAADYLAARVEEAIGYINDYVVARAAVGLANERIGQIVPGWVPAPKGLVPREEPVWISRLRSNIAGLIGRGNSLDYYYGSGREIDEIGLLPLSQINLQPGVLEETTKLIDSRGKGLTFRARLKNYLEKQPINLTLVESRLTTASDRDIALLVLASRYGLTPNQVYALIDQAEKVTLAEAFRVRHAALLKDAIEVVTKRESVGTREPSSTGDVLDFLNALTGRTDRPVGKFSLEGPTGEAFTADEFTRALAGNRQLGHYNPGLDKQVQDMKNFAREFRRRTAGISQGELRQIRKALTPPESLDRILEFVTRLANTEGNTPVYVTIEEFVDLPRQLEEAAILADAPPYGLTVVNETSLSQIKDATIREALLIAYRALESAQGGIRGYHQLVEVQRIAVGGTPFGSSEVINLEPTGIQYPVFDHNSTKRDLFNKGYEASPQEITKQVLGKVAEQIPVMRTRGARPRDINPEGEYLVAIVDPKRNVEAPKIMDVVWQTRDIFFYIETLRVKEPEGLFGYEIDYHPSTDKGRLDGLPAGTRVRQTYEDREWLKNDDGTWSETEPETTTYFKTGPEERPKEGR